jgi:predicted enzyme related to lactoylglutathione lyase
MRVAIAVAIALIAGCKGDRPRVSAVSNTPTGDYQHGRFVWHDLMTHDLAEVKQFYGGLFGWEFETAAEGGGVYTTIRHDDKPIGGIVALDKVEGEVHSQWLSYLSVADVDASSGAARAQGGKVYRKPFDLPDRGRVAVLLDNREAVVGLVSATGGDPAFDKPVYDEWLWHELWSDEVGQSMEFYEDLMGYERENLKLGDYDYGVLAKDGKLRGAVVEIVHKGVTPNWLPYVAVPDPAAVIAKVEALGGKVLIKSEKTGENRAAIIADPSGAAFGVHIWPLPQNIRREGAR